MRHCTHLFAHYLTLLRSGIRRFGNLHDQGMNFVDDNVGLALIDAVLCGCLNSGGLDGSLCLERDVLQQEWSYGQFSTS